jgi:polysulfide reductase-like protein
LSDAVSYYGRPIVKEPVWKPEIPTYFFTGGLAGAAATLAFGARLAGNDELARRALYVNTAAITVSPVLLIKDLGRPKRFYNMLRVFKVTSPMSVGTWIVSASGTASGIRASCELLGVLPRVKLAAETVAGLLGPFLSTYTAALVADSVVPAWHEARRELPFVFAGSSAASAGGAVAALAPAAVAGPARRLALVGGALELAATKRMEDRLGELVGEPYHTGKGGTLSKAAKATTAAGAGLMALAGRRRPGAVVAGALLCTGALLERFAVFHAGKASARDPRYTSVPQRERAARG